MKNLKLGSLIVIICYTLLHLASCRGACLNPDCKFQQLEAPVTLTAKSYDVIVLTDKNGETWTSSTGWHIAKSILVEGYSVGDTIVYDR